MFKKIIQKAHSLELFLPILIIAIIVLCILTVGDSFLAYSIMGLVSLLIVVFFTAHQYKKERLTTLLIFILPILVYGVMVLVSNFSSIELSIVNRVFIPIGLVSFALLGYLSGYSKYVKVGHILTAIYIAIGFVTLVNFIITLSEVGCFYAYNYKDFFYYYNGNASRTSVSGIAFCIIGFKKCVTSIEYYSLFPTLLLTCSVGCFFYAKSKLIQRFNMTHLNIVLSLFALVVLILTSSKYMIITDVVTVLLIIGIVLVGKFPKLRKVPLNIIWITGVSVIGIYFILLLINAQPGMVSFRSFIKSNGFTNYLFNTNYLAVKYNLLLEDVFTQSKLFGFGIYTTSSGATVIPSGNIIIDQFMYGGVFVFVVFLTISVLGFKMLYNYAFKYPGSKYTKSLLITFLTAFFLYSLVNNGVMRDPTTLNVDPIFMTPLFLICSYLFGFVFFKNNKGVVKNA